MSKKLGFALSGIMLAMAAGTALLLTIWTAVN